MVTRVLICLALAGMLGCEKRSTKYCGLHPNDLANCEQTDAPLPDPVACEMDSQCTGGHCELDANVCVECLDNAHCEAGERCDTGGSFTCRGCISNTDCPGGTCLPGGSCGDDSAVIYVDAAGTDNDACTMSAPCATLTHALDLVTTARRYMSVTGSFAESPVITVDVEILAGDNARIEGAPTIDWVIKVQGAVVKIYGLEIFCAGGDDANGIKAESSSTLTLDGVEISGCGRTAALELKGGFAIVTRSNIYDNSAGGIKSDGSAQLSITNNWIHHNGALTKAFGGLDLDNDPATSIKVEFNTIVDNQLSGLKCKSAFAAPNNIIGGNGTLLASNVSTTCDASGSIVTDDLAPLEFTNRTTEPYDYHIGATSTAKDNTSVPSTVLDDIDRDLRPQDAAKDYGADEYKAP